MSVEWSKLDVERLIKYAKDTFTEKDRITLETSVRNGTGTEHLTHKNKVPSEDDVITECISDLWSCDDELIIILQETIETAAKSYNNIVLNGLKDGLRLTKEFEDYLISTSWKKSLNKCISKYVLSKVQFKFDKMSKDGQLFVIGKNCNNIKSQDIGRLMNMGYVVIESFSDIDTLNLFKELEFMEFNGLFNKSVNNSIYHECYNLWLKTSYLNDEYHKTTHEILEVIKDVPYELANKCKLLLQVISTICVVYMEPNKSHIKRHSDKSINGVRYTLIYTGHIPSSNVYIKLTADESVDVKLKSNELIILKNDVEYEISNNSVKTFLLTTWITGPCEKDKCLY